MFGGDIFRVLLHCASAVAVCDLRRNTNVIYAFGFVYSYSLLAVSTVSLTQCRDRASVLVNDRARLLLLFNLSSFLSFELSRYCSLIGSFV